MLDADAPPPRANGRILVVDDDESARLLLKIVLEHEGHRVSQADDGLEAVAVFQHEAPDLVLLDLMMPGQDGFTTCRQLQTLPQGTVTPVIVITALNDYTSLHRAFDAGAVDYITKPIDMTALKIRVQRSLRMRAAEMAVRRAEAKYRGIFENSSEGLFQTTKQGRILNVNPALARILGYDSPEEIESRITDVATQLYLRPDDRQHVVAALETQGEIYAFETELYRRDGRPVWVSLNARRVVDEQGQAHYEGALEDITARRQAEQALRDSETRYRQMFERNRALKLLIDPADGLIVDANPAAVEFYGYPREQLLNLKISDINQLPAEQIKQEMELARSEQRAYFIFPHRLASGETRQVEVYSGPVEVQGRQFLYSIIHDITERQQAEAALRASEEKYRQLVSSIEGIVWETDARTEQITYVSPQAERILGYPIERWLNEPDFWSIHIHPEDRDDCVQHSAAATAAGRDHVLEYRMIAADGGIIWLHDLVKVLRDDNDQAAILRGVMIDVTARKQAEEKLEQVHRQMDLILNSAGEGIFGLDRQGCITFSNAATAQMVGRTQAEMQGHYQHALIHHSYADGTPYPPDRCPVYAAFHDGKIHRISSEVFWRKDGTCFPVEYVSTPIREDDQLLGAVVVFRDVTERLQVERALKESEQQFRQVMETVQVIGAVLDGDGHILFSNEYLSRLTGWPREELLNRDFFDTLTPPEYRAERKQTLAEYSEQEAPPDNLTFESKVLLCDGAQRLIAWKIAFMHDWHDQTLRWMVLGEDITERRKVELQTIQADRLAALGRLAAALAHEINNPLQAIQSHLELVLDFPLPEEERLEYLQVVRQQIGRLNDITRNVLNFAKPSPAPRSLIAIDELIEQMLKLAGKQLEHSHIRVTKELNAACYMLAAPEQMVQVFLNLTINAIEAIQSDGHLHISSRCVNDQAIITFANDGPAIAPPDLSHIFEPFFTTKSEGTGLGLSVSHSLVRQHGGQLKVENLTPDRGVVFTITLPLIPLMEREHAD